MRMRAKSNRKSHIKRRLMTLLSKIDELQQIERDARIVIPCNLENWKQDLMNAYSSLWPPRYPYAATGRYRHTVIGRKVKPNKFAPRCSTWKRGNRSITMAIPPSLIEQHRNWKWKSKRSKPMARASSGSWAGKGNENKRIQTLGSARILAAS